MLTRYCHRLAAIAVVCGLVALAACGGGFQNAAKTGEKISEFGRYSGYSERRFTHFHRSSVYVSARDGTRLAVDVFRPGDAGGPTDEPLPVLFNSSRYPRATLGRGGSIVTQLGTLRPGESSGPLMARDLMMHGYVYVRLQARGTGASEGVRLGEASWPEVLDHKDVIDWIVEQPWSTDKVGMLGVSWMGWSQLQAAASRPEALTAIFPAMPSGDAVRDISHYGILRSSVLEWAESQSNRDVDVHGIHVPVDADEDGAMLLEIIEERRRRAAESNTNPSTAIIQQDPGLLESYQALRAAAGLDSIRDVPALLLDHQRLSDLLARSPGLQALLVAKLNIYRDTVRGYHVFDEAVSHPFTLLDKINASGVPVYLWSGWLDGANDSASFLYQGLTMPDRRVVFGNFSHGPPSSSPRPRELFAKEALAIERHRWFDYWLKGIDNGIADEPPVRYAIAVGPDDMEWRTDQTWPPAAVERRSFYFADGPSGSIASLNDGLLLEAPAAVSGFDGQTADYTATMGRKTRYWRTNGGAPHLDYPDLEAHGERALTFSTPPLEADMDVVGSPVVTIHTTADTSDLDYFVYLEEVDAKGAVTYVSDGMMRASFRTLGEPLYEVGDVPWPDGRRAVVEATPPLDEGVAMLTFDLMPTGYRFDRGHRIRVVITHADADNGLVVPQTPRPEAKIVFGGEYASRISLPVLTK